MKKKILIILIIALLLIVTILIIPKNRLKSTTKVDGLIIRDNIITFDEKLSISFLSANVKNSSKTDKSDVKLKITFLNKKKNEITSVIGFLGDVSSSEIKELNVAISQELKDVVNIKYEISQ